MCQEVVTVIDDGIVVAHLVVLIILGEIESRQTLQVGRGGHGGGHQVAACLTEEDGAVGDGLQLVEDANDTVNRVCRIIQFVVLSKDDML